MHQSLWLRRSNIEDTACFPQQPQDQRIVGALVVPPGDKSTIQAKAFHANVLFDADWQAMERTGWLLVGCQIVIKVFGTCQSSRGKELSDAVGLSLRVRKELRYSIWEACKPTPAPARPV